MLALRELKDAVEDFIVSPLPEDAADEFVRRVRPVHLAFPEITATFSKPMKLLTLSLTLPNPAIERTFASEVGRQLWGRDTYEVVQTMTLMGLAYHIFLKGITTPPSHGVMVRQTSEKANTLIIHFAPSIIPEIILATSAITSKEMLEYLVNKLINVFNRSAASLDARIFKLMEGSSVTHTLDLRR